MQETKITFTVRHAQNNLSPGERFPVADCFLDSRWDREATRIHLKPEHQQITVSGRLDKNTRELPISAGIGIATWAWRKNEYGNPCLIDTGVTQVYLRDILLGTKNSKDGTYRVQGHVLMNTANNLEKGQLELVFHRDGIQLGNTQIAMHIDAQLVGIGASMMQHINSTLQMEQEMEDTIPGTERMRVPYNYSESGIQSTGGNPLPAVSYVMAETPKTNTLYWENAHDNIMKRDHAKWEQLNKTGKARATVLMLAYCAQYLDYIGDQVDRAKRFEKALKKLEGYENFGDSISTWSGDCEDLATGIAQCKNAFDMHTFPKDTKFDKFREMQRISRSYLNPLSLDAVRGAQVNQVAHVGAHMNDNFIPVEQFMRDMNKTPEGREMLKKLPKPKDVVSGLPFMIGEGTGMYEPLGEKNPRLECMQYVYQARSLEGFKKPITHTQSEIGSFFIGSLIGMTDYFYRLGAEQPMAFWYCTRTGNELTRGSTYEDMIFHDEKVALKPQPPLSRPVMKLVDEAVKLRVPPRPLTLSETEEHKTNHHLEFIVNEVNKLNRKQGPAWKYAPVYIRPHQLSEKLAREMTGDFKRLTNVCKIDYQLERITDEIWGYRMHVYCQ